MKDFAMKQYMLHMRAASIAKLLADQQATVSVCAENMESESDPERAAYWQQRGDEATAACLKLQVSYFAVLRQIMEPVTLAKDQTNNAVIISEPFNLSTPTA